jgi:hypothetical protein
MDNIQHVGGYIPFLRKIPLGMRIQLSVPFISDDRQAEPTRPKSNYILGCHLWPEVADVALSSILLASMMLPVFPYQHHVMGPPL